MALCPKSGENTETLTGVKVLTATSARFQFLNASGAPRQVTLPAEEDSKGLFFMIFETGDSYGLAVKEDTGTTTIITISAGKAGLVACNGTVWKGLLGS